MASIEELIINIGHAINSNNGQCSLIEGTLTQALELALRLRGVPPGKLIIMPDSLTAENGAKALLVGEFFETVTVPNVDYCGCGHCEFCQLFPDAPETLEEYVPVSWTTIKAIYAMAAKHLGKPLAEATHS